MKKIHVDEKFLNTGMHISKSNNQLSVDLICYLLKKTLSRIEIY